jgi:phenylalanyl-tRNA synthetase alpha chain
MYNSYSEELGKWMEVGNSGVFRPEMLQPMGLPPDVSVIAWGLSLERPTMILYGIDNIRDLFGHKVRVPHARFVCICRCRVCSCMHDVLAASRDHDCCGLPLSGPP